jgi:hypothetical protein
MQWLLPRCTIRRLSLLTAVACPLSASLIGYTTGIRCPPCFSGQTVRVYRYCLITQTPDGQTHEEYGTPLGWCCSGCGLEW